MAQYKYMGPSDEFIVGDKTYKQGDNLNVSEAFVQHHKTHGHVFQKGDELIGKSVQNPVAGVENKAVTAAENK